MNFLIDAQLPRRLAHCLRDAGHDAIHTLDLPDRNRTTDGQVNEMAEREDRIVVTKDADFVDSFVLQRKPKKLLVISTGNITNSELEAIMLPRIPAIAAAFEFHDYVELTRTAIIVHE